MNFTRISLIASFILSFPVLNAKPSRFVLTGGQCIGKTTLIEYFKAQGFQVCPECFISLRNKYEQAGKLELFLHTLNTDVVAFQTWMLDTQCELENQLDLEQPTFFDRGALDGMAFILHRGSTVPQKIIDKASSRSYDLIFFLDPLPDELYDQAGFRRETPEDARAIHQHLKNIYAQHGYTIVNVPFDTVENRAQFILRKIEEYQSVTTK